MWARTTAALCMLFLAGEVHANDPLQENRDVGGSLTLIVQTGNLPDIGCYVVTPKDELIEFRPEDKSDDRFVLRNGTVVTHCSVEITKLSKNDEGLWKIYYTVDGETKTTIFYQLTINLDGETSDDPIEPFPETKNVGESLAITVQTGNLPDIGCYVVTPKNELIEFRPEDKSDNRFQLRAGTFVTHCYVEITNLTKSDEGLWKIYYTIDDVIKKSNYYQLTITSDEEESNEEKQSEEDLNEDVEITWLTTYKLITTVGKTHDISLSKLYYDEDCTIAVPNGETKALKDVELPGIRVQDSSHFVSCRITVGPMTQELIGVWTICGMHRENELKHKRCQHVEVEWHNANSPTSSWNTYPIPKFDHVVNFNGTLSPGIRSFVNTITCHVITPDGEDLVITPDSEYPGLALNSGQYLCSVTMSPINKFFLGEWVLYGIFRNSVTEENVLPMSLSLYDEENPYNQAYNVTVMDPLTEVVNLGNTIDLEVPVTGNLDNCEVVSPSGQRYILNGAKGTEAILFVGTGCHVAIGPITDGMVGDWQMIGKFNERDIFTERRQALHIIKEDPENPIIDENRIVTEIEAQFFNITMGSSQNITTSTRWLYTVESCHLRTPTGRQYTIMEGFNIPGIDVRQETSEDIACGVTVNVISEDLLGDWVLIAREIRNREPHEIRQPFTIYVEERVNALPQHVTIIEGKDLYVRLENSTEKYESCKLFEPTREERVDYALDTPHNNTCGFIVKDVQKSDSGEWEIRYGDGITYRAFIDVDVKGVWETEETNLTWIQGRSIDVTVGPEDAIYCKVEDPQMRVAFEGFSRCYIVIDRVTIKHDGVWKATVGLPGKVLPEEFTFNVHVRSSENKPVVITHVVKEQPVVSLSCSVPIEYEVKSCSFREPSGRVLMASQGVGEDRYAFHGVGTSFESDIQSHECGLRISDPLTSDMGLWRCAVQTDKEVYYGFLTVLCPWAMSIPENVALVISEPTLTVQGNIGTILEGESVSLSCSIQSAIRYCYFRARNGTVFNVSPAEPSQHVEYLGAGLDAGECGIRFRNMVALDSGQWSCHVGLPDFNEPEQRVDFQLDITQPIVVQQDVLNDVLMIRGQVYNDATLEYCRYVRMDGVGFTTATLPSRYTTHENLSRGICALHVNSPTILDMHPWTVAAKIADRDAEVAGVSDHTIEISTEYQPESDATQLPELLPQPAASRNYHVLAWIMVIITGTLLISFGMLFIPPKNRRRTITKATIWRNSIRSSFTKKPLPVFPVNNETTA